MIEFRLSPNWELISEYHSKILVLFLIEMFTNDTLPLRLILKSFRRSEVRGDILCYLSL